MIRTAVLMVGICIVNGCGQPTATDVRVGGTVSGLTGTGLVLRNNADDDLTIISNGNFTFRALAPGATYSVTVQTQPSSPTQTCTVAHGTGTLDHEDVTNVEVTCGDSFFIAGTVTGLVGTGLVLKLNGANDLTINMNGPFGFAAALTSGATYHVTVGTRPMSPTQNCLVANHSGTVMNTGVTNVAVTCAIPAASLAAADLHTCAIRTDGTLACWGQNSRGQLGDGTMTDKASPVQVGSATNWLTVAAGLQFTCATRVDGTLWCWGTNYNGQLGDGSMMQRSSPVQVGTGTSWTSVSTGGFHTCAT